MIIETERTTFHAQTDIECALIEESIMEDKSDSTRPEDTSPFPQKDTTEFSTEYKRDL